MVKGFIDSGLPYCQYRTVLILDSRDRSYILWI